MKLTTHAKRYLRLYDAGNKKTKRELYQLVLERCMLLEYQLSNVEYQLEQTKGN